jgi:hypothetical protein
MADSVNRIVPPSISPEHSAALGKEREKRNRDSFQRRNHEEKNSSARRKKMKEDQQEILGESERERTKGKHLDVNV